AIATALTAWLSAPAPTTCTSTTPCCRRTPAIAPATEFGFDFVDTLSCSIGDRVRRAQSDPFLPEPPIPAGQEPGVAELVAERDRQLVGVDFGARHAALCGLADAHLRADPLGDLDHDLGVVD